MLFVTKYIRCQRLTRTCMTDSTVDRCYTHLVTCLCAGIWVAQVAAPQDDLFEQFMAWVTAHQAYAPLYYTVAALVLSILGFPGMIICGVGGALFGFWKGGLLYTIAGAGTSVISFWAARGLLRKWVESKLSTRAQLMAIKQALENEGFLFLCMVRFLPVHNTIMSSILAQTRTRFWPFFFSSLSQVPIWLIFVYLGTVAQQAAAGEINSPWALVPRVVSVVGFLVAMVYVTKVARRAVAEQMAAQQKGADDTSPTP